MAKATKNVPGKRHSHYSNVVILIPPRSVGQNVGEFFWSLTLTLGKENYFLVFTYSIKCKIKKFHVVVGQRRQRNVQKSMMHVQSWCLVNFNLLLFWTSHCHHRCHCGLSSLITHCSVSFTCFTTFEDCLGTSWSS